METTTMLDMCNLANLQPGKRITILGAGIAGLVAAYELERMGHQVDIISVVPASVVEFGHTVLVTKLTHLTLNLEQCVSPANTNIHCIMSRKWV